MFYKILDRKYVEITKNIFNFCTGSLKKEATTLNFIQARFSDGRTLKNLNGLDKRVNL